MKLPLLSVLWVLVGLHWLQSGNVSAQVSITNEELKDMSELLFSLDKNKAHPSELIINPQRLIPNSETNQKVDLSTEPLYTFVDEATLFTKPTYAALIKLLDNYNRMTGTAEHFTKEQVAEQEAFLKKVVTDTEIGRQLSTFLLAKGVYTSEAELIQDLQMMWFGLYSRNKGQLDSSGFEHVFVGEIKSSKVSGFHNWVQFYLLERRGQLNYYSHNFDGPWAGFPDILGMQFNWSGYFKEVGSAFIGSSPEFDFAIYSLCYITRPGKMCHLSLGGKAQSIQTYTWTNSFYGDGKMFIASAYPVSP
ncbi:uridylate-specific endoribonuclease A [Erpetoichthys calabaricus]|uniref:uridylate-specific endoribonuclease A n=1 Tax=Erpetoichthys calabaricus TaxID=27687 RepID=UPI00109F0CBE|nr:uridylate-specific endoribonuclease A [Erpetoichthys calabaricus]